MTTASFASRLLVWFDSHGRKDLPWQHPIEAYRVWVSEIMLQQTQVETVIPYFQRFMARFPSVHDLAEAPLDEVLHHWTGLGYYARARNLHKCAQTVVSSHGGEFPGDVHLLAQLPGIGPSTAAAIASIAFGKQAAILDGNVKRVLARHGAVSGWPGERHVANILWEMAEKYMPGERCRDYTQAIMDLGATLCTRSKPRCDACPVSADCQARAAGQPTAYPAAKPKKIKPVKEAYLLLLQNPDGSILLQQRPPTGIWGGLWSFPELELGCDLVSHIDEHYGTVKNLHRWDCVRHSFSHYHFNIHPVHVLLNKLNPVVREAPATVWLNPLAPQQLGLAAPVKALLAQLATDGTPPHPSQQQVLAL